MADIETISISSGPYCPKCGDRLVSTVIDTDPPSYKYICFKCGSTYADSELLNQLITPTDKNGGVTAELSKVIKDKVLDALRNRFEGCELCKGAKYLTCTLYSEKPYRDGILVTEIRDEDGGAADIEYCPVCGRPLTDESLKKLADKIFEILEETL